MRAKIVAATREKVRWIISTPEKKRVARVEDYQPPATSTNEFVRQTMSLGG